jgi:hypothetical protein
LEYLTASPCDRSKQNLAAGRLCSVYLDGYVAWTSHPAALIIAERFLWQSTGVSLLSSRQTRKSGPWRHLLLQIILHPLVGDVEALQPDFHQSAPLPVAKRYYRPLAMFESAQSAGHIDRGTISSRYRVVSCGNILGHLSEAMQFQQRRPSVYHRRQRQSAIHQRIEREIASIPFSTSVGSCPAGGTKKFRRCRLTPSLNFSSSGQVFVPTHPCRRRDPHPLESLRDSVHPLMPISNDNSFAQIPFWQYDENSHSPRMEVAMSSEALRFLQQDNTRYRPRPWRIKKKLPPSSGTWRWPQNCTRPAIES